MTVSPVPRSQRLGEGKMTNRSPIILVAAVLLLAVLDLPRSSRAETLEEFLDRAKKVAIEEPVRPAVPSIPPATAEFEKLIFEMKGPPTVECPCGDPKKTITDLDVWKGDVKCEGPKVWAGGVSLTQPLDGPIARGLFSQDINGRGDYSCRYFPKGGTADQIEYRMTKDQYVACTYMILEYTKKIEANNQTSIKDNGCYINAQYQTDR